MNEQEQADNQRVRRELWAAIYRQAHEQSATRVQPEFCYAEAADRALERFDKRFAPAGVTVVYGSSAPRPPCTVCGKPYAEHGTFPTCASHPYTPDRNCQHVIGAACVGAECAAGCVRARGAKEGQRG